MNRGRAKYCSSLLVNAILALACQFSEREEARGSIADHFFQEAKRLLMAEGENPCLTSVQALALMSLREAGCGHNSSGWMYSGRAFRMALDLGLNLQLEWEGLSPTETEVRKITFWGCFTLDKSVSQIH
jgi:Fungal specific transcription factor domain